MNIKHYLKKIGMTQTELANQLHLSRPTLDSYIVQYEETQSLSKEKYQIVFDNLFGPELPKEVFVDTLKDFEVLFSQDEKYELCELEPEETDLFISVMANMRNDMKREEHSDNVYRFVNMIISNYRREPIFKHMIDYFLFLNGLLDENEIAEDQKQYLAYLYDVFYHFPKEEQPYDGTETYTLLLRRREEIRESRNKHQSESTQRILDRTRVKVDALERQGIQVSEEMMKDIISGILNTAE